MAENYEIFSGLSSAEPQEIRDALGGLETVDQEAIPNLIGAVMTLCTRVHALETELGELRSLVTPLDHR